MTRAHAILAGLVLLLSAAVAPAQNMPDPSLIHGKALPATELPSGTVTVRVVRESIGNDLPGQTVTLTIGGAARTAKTDDQGRAEFTDLPRGAEGRAETAVDGETLVSDPFTVPAAGGLRVILVSGIAQAAERRKQAEAQALAAPPVKGTVVIGGETRIIGEFQGDDLQMFYQLDIVNSARTRVDIGGPLLLDLPAGAGGAAITEGPKSASLDGRHLTVQGPFDPGTTSVSLRFVLRYSGHAHTFVQTWPVSVQQWVVGFERVNNASVSSKQFQRTEERPTESGLYIVGTGAPMPAGSSLTMEMTGLPAQSKVAATWALAIALGILGIGAFLAFSARRPTDARPALEAKRHSLLTSLEELERSRGNGTIGADRYASRRERLMKELEHVYGELDATGAPPSGGGTGVAA